MDQVQFQAFRASFVAAMQTASTSTANSSLILNFETFKKDTEKFSQYRERFENFVEMKGITNQTMKKKIFLNCNGNETYEIVQSTR